MAIAATLVAFASILPQYKSLEHNCNCDRNRNLKYDMYKAFDSTFICIHVGNYVLIRSKATLSF